MGDEFIPHFRDERLQALNVCSFFSYESESIFDAAPLRAQASCSLGDGKDGLIRVVLDRSKARADRGHFHVEVGRPTFFSDRKTFDEKELAVIGDLIGKLAGHDCHLFYDVYHTVPIGDLPPGGFIWSLFDLSGVAGGAELNMVGSKFSISEEGFIELTWHINDEDEDEGETINTDLSAYVESRFNTKYLQAAVDYMQAGFERFVLEVPREKKALDERSSKIAEKKTAQA